MGQSLSFPVWLRGRAGFFIREKFISLLYSLFACVTLYLGINFTKDQGIHAISYDSICGSSCDVLYLISFRNSMLDISTIYNRQEGRKEGC